jgi:hypothetical protein
MFRAIYTVSLVKKFFSDIQRICKQTPTKDTLPRKLQILAQHISERREYIHVRSHGKVPKHYTGKHSIAFLP